MAREALYPIGKPPGDNNTVLLRKNLLNHCLYACFVGTDASCTYSVVLNDDTLKRSHMTTFDSMLDPLAAYDPNITVFEGAHHADEQKWAANLTNQSIIRANERGFRKFILHVIEEMSTWRLNNRYW